MALVADRGSRRNLGTGKSLSFVRPLVNPLFWRPGEGPDATALARLQSRFARPAEMMGEAWFMGIERRMFEELRGDLSLLTARQLQTPLNELASGTSYFGPLEEWNAWYHYLLGHLVPRCHEAFVSSLLESLITGFFALYPNGVVHEPYRGFHADVLETLGRCMMDSRCWRADEIVVGNILHRSNNNPNKVWCWWDASGDLSASLHFCLKYLPGKLVPGWYVSALSIPSPHWRAQLIAWLVGAHDTLQGAVRWPSEWEIGARPSVSWEWSHCLHPELASTERPGESAVESLLPEASCRAVLEVTREHFTEEVFLDWLTSIQRYPYLERELAEIPSAFEALYVGRGEALYL